MTLNKKLLKKLPYQLSLLLLTAGASLILGFLSFGGMYALFPFLSLAFAAFGLSVAYEGEIYLQNIKGALNKLFKADFLKHQIARQYLLLHFPDTTAEDCPQFFKDYEAQLHLLNQFGDKRLDKQSRKQKKQIAKTLKDMEKWFSAQFFAKQEDATAATDYDLELRNWLAKHAQSEWRATFIRRNYWFQGVKAFSAFAGIFMGLGTTYLLVEAFSAIPLLAFIPFAAWPLMIVPMAIVAGAAYGLLTYNAITDMISNNTLGQWYNKIRDDFKKGFTVKNVFMAMTTTLLVAMAIALTICTAGTWWTVVKEARPLFNWMGKLPGFIMGVINPIITGLSAVVFNLQNTSETLELIDGAISHHDHHHSSSDSKSGFLNTIQRAFANLRQRENWGQLLNPFRLLLKLTFTPLRILLFIGHLVGIAVTADRVPGIPQTLSALFGLISEGFEDAHYFIPHAHHHHHGEAQTKDLLDARLGAEHSHSHDNDLPTRFLKLLFSPLIMLAAAWDCAASQFNKDPRKPMSFASAWNKQRGIPMEQTVTLKTDSVKPSSAWQKAHVLHRIERQKQKESKEHDKLSALQQEIRDEKPEQVISILGQRQKHGFFAHQENKAFLEALPERVAGPSLAG
ncbi:hypothetical protein [Legionella impletisoli]|uniref:Uncharacterized protein n=1 Tax=Legionella impletisoli TaxID=343510 RepID=A0A917JTM7_9GAMM|nr:hypothetical protein [Legionella impletisoli]GGI84483.1 hypothetical protein GCM10007966_11380 [Legionella impletisoli]